MSKFFSMYLKRENPYEIIVTGMCILKNYEDAINKFSILSILFSIFIKKDIFSIYDMYLKGFFFMSE